ncbi:leucine-rich repeat extensin-like protein 5 [Ananas comosus]|uniref:Leucine-rich repeat extensin-like protein 5 n=1 Tax=Ananas comosus TaxID=4615 RepID=A0A6P5EDJ4_ANACO|nr:leucine-rich repeat extensin-like protein 5 [Ananas comosus]
MAGLAIKELLASMLWALRWNMGTTADHTIWSLTTIRTSTLRRRVAPSQLAPRHLPHIPAATLAHPRHLSTPPGADLSSPPTLNIFSISSPNPPPLVWKGPGWPPHDPPRIAPCSLRPSPADSRSAPPVPALRSCGCCTPGRSCGRVPQAALAAPLSRPRTPHFDSPCPAPSPRGAPDACVACASSDQPPPKPSRIDSVVSFHALGLTPPARGLPVRFLPLCLGPSRRLPDLPPSPAENHPTPSSPSAGCRCSARRRALLVANTSVARPYLSPGTRSLPRRGPLPAWNLPRKFPATPK